MMRTGIMSPGTAARSAAVNWASVGAGSRG
jgi:hypothetical protein